MSCRGLKSLKNSFELCLEFLSAMFNRPIEIVNDGE